MKSSGNIKVDGQLSQMGTVDLGLHDTLLISNPDPEALVGSGIINGGCIRRALRQTYGTVFSFESNLTNISFSSGTIPPYVAMTVYPDTNATSFGTDWVQVPSHANSISHLVYADSLQEFSRWTIKVPRPKGQNTSSVSRVYSVDAESEGHFTARLSLRYDVSELAAEPLKIHSNSSD